MSSGPSVLEPEVASARPLGPWANGLQMSPDEFVAIDHWDDEFRYELLNGVLVVSPAPAIGERGPNDLLGYLLLDYKYRHPQGAALDETVFEQTLRTSTGFRRADRVIWCGYGRPIDPVRDVPTIAVEFVSETSRDRRRDFVHKRQEYAAAGIREYWIIDRFRQNLTVMRGEDVAVMDAEASYQTELLPGFVVPVNRLLDASRRWAAGGGPSLSEPSTPS